MDAVNLILLSGGSGTRLWPLSNGVRSKQFLRLLKAPNGESESMAQRIVRQIGESKLNCNLYVATNTAQKDCIEDQIGGKISGVITEPERRDTFPAIALAVEYLLREKNLSESDVAVVMPIDPYTESGYFSVVEKMAQYAKKGGADLVLMGIKPKFASQKFGYIVPEKSQKNGAFKVLRFAEKPDEKTAQALIDDGAFWNGGVFAFKLGYIKNIAEKYVKTAKSFGEFCMRYNELPKISFDYEVAETAQNVAMIGFDGQWKDLGTWNTLCGEMSENILGNAVCDGNVENSHIINELGIPVVCLGLKNTVVAAAYDGILVAEKDSVVNLKEYAESVKTRPMYERRIWGEYAVLNCGEHSSKKSLTKLLKIAKGSQISYHRHNHRTEVWTCVDGTGTVVVDGAAREISAGDTVKLERGVLHSIAAKTPLTVIEVQLGDILSEDDIQRI